MSRERVRRRWLAAIETLTRELQDDIEDMQHGADYDGVNIVNPFA